MTTLISCIGVGQIKETGEKKGYTTLKYTLPACPGVPDCPQTVVTSCSTNAIIQSKRYSFDHIVIIGTETSSWGELLEQPSPEEEDLFLELITAAEQKTKTPFKADSPQGIQLQTLLEKRWQATVKLVVHAQDLDDRHSSDIFKCYVDTFLAQKQDIVLDATHGFRWMPLFLSSAIQFKEAFGELNSLKILYAEQHDKETGTIRRLDTLWDGHEQADAVSLFLDKFETEKLKTYLWDVCPKLFSALENFCNCLQSNYLMPLVWDRTQPDFQIGIPLKTLKNALDAFDKLDNPPAWSRKIASKAKDWLKALQNTNYPSERLLILGDMYHERQFHCQAALTLDVAFGMIACERKGTSVEYPDWDTLRKFRDQLFDAIHDRKAYPNLSQEQRSTIHDLANQRNMVAHGALNSTKNRDSTPTVPTIARLYEKQRKTLQALINMNSF